MNIRPVAVRHLTIGVLAFGIGVLPAAAQQATADAPAAQAPGTAQLSQPTTRKSWLKVGEEWIQSGFAGSESRRGFYPEFRGLPPGSGISVGPGFRHGLFDGRASIDASTAISWSRGKFGQAAFELPHIAGHQVSVGTQIKWQDFTRLNYFGIGPASTETNRTDYRLQNADYNAFAAVKPRDWLTFGGRVGFSQRVNIKPGTSAVHPPTRELFTDATAPGLVDHPAFLHSDAYIGVDTRDHPGYPHSGGVYRVTLSDFNDRDFDRFSFRRIEAEAAHFIPILHENWVIALRGRIAASDTSNGAIVPFYLLPTLGGGNSLRGYDDYRFRDRNLLLLNAEYRWRVFGALDNALFYDAGKVASRFGDLDLTHMRTLYGIGFRFHTNDTTFVRLDIGRSKEGTRVLLSIGDVLKSGHGSIFIPYVP